MAFKPGESGNPAGRPQGSGNVKKKQLQEKLTDIMLRSIEDIQDDLDKLSPPEKLKFIETVLPYAIPKYKPVEKYDLDEKPKRGSVYHDIQNQYIKHGRESYIRNKAKEVGGKS